MSDELKPDNEIDAAEPATSDSDEKSAEHRSNVETSTDGSPISRRNVLTAIGGVWGVSFLLRGLWRAGMFDGPKIEPPSLNLDDGSIETSFHGDSHLTLNWSLQGLANIDQVTHFQFGVVARNADGKRIVGEIDPFDLMNGRWVRQSGTLKIDLRDDWQKLGPSGMVPPPIMSGGFGPRHRSLQRGDQPPELMEVTIVHSLAFGHPVPVSNMIKVPVTNHGPFSPLGGLVIPSQVDQ